MSECKGRRETWFEKWKCCCWMAVEFLVNMFRGMEWKRDGINDRLSEEVGGGEVDAFMILVEILGCGCYYQSFLRVR